MGLTSVFQIGQKVRIKADILQKLIEAHVNNAHGKQQIADWSQPLIIKELSPAGCGFDYSFLPTGQKDPRYYLPDDSLEFLPTTLEDCKCSSRDLFFFGHKCGATQSRP